jgi:hypothetical protein
MIFCCHILSIMEEIEVPDNKYFPEGMEINDAYRFNVKGVNCYVYEGLCDNIPTKWITKSNWDFKINVCNEDGGVYYRDSNGELILVLEKDDPNDALQWEAIRNTQYNKNTDVISYKVGDNGEILYKIYIKPNGEWFKYEDKILSNKKAR